MRNKLLYVPGSFLHTFSNIKILAFQVTKTKMKTKTTHHRQHQKMLTDTKKKVTIIKERIYP